MLTIRLLAADLWYNRLHTYCTLRCHIRAITSPRNLFQNS